MSETIKYYEIPKWGWECPCGEFNEVDDNPEYIATMVCEDCGEEYSVFEEII